MTARALATSSASSRAYEAQLAAFGIFAETYPHSTIANSSAIISGSQYSISIGLCAAQVVSKIGVHVIAAGTNLTLAKAALLDKNGNRLAVTADEKANLSVGCKLLDVLTPYLVPSSDLYYLSFLDTHSTTGVALARTLATSTDTRLPGFAYGAFGITTGQTDIQAAATINYAGASMLPIWMCVA